MFCFVARRQFADDIEGTLRGRRRDDLARHLGACAACSSRRASQARIAQILRDESGVGPPLGHGVDLRSDPNVGHGASLSAGAAARLAIGFEDRLMREIRSRRAGADGGTRPVMQPRLDWTRETLSPTPLAAALTIMVAAGLAGLYLGGYVATKGFTPRLVSSASDRAGNEVAVSRTGQADDLISREVPFTIRQDLLGQRRGRIPLTTYVLEPAPHESTVVQASF